MRHSTTSLLALLLTSVFVRSSAQAQSVGQIARPKDEQIIRLAPIRQLRKGVDAWPLILNPSSPAEQRVNATLMLMNDRLKMALRDCDAAYGKWVDSASDSTATGGMAYGDWSRTVTITMTGPRYLSLVATDGVFCGGAHPGEDQIALVFDMATGMPVNWLTRIPNSAGASNYSDTVADGSIADALALPALRRMSITAAVPECRDAFNDPQPFLLWPDARKERLVAQPFDMPHAVQACAEEIDLTIEQARQLGFAEDLLEAIREAHRNPGVQP